MVNKTHAQMTLVKTETFQKVTDSQTWLVGDARNADFFNQPRHTFGFTAYDKDEAIGYLSFSTDFALFGQITLLKTHPAYDDQALEILLLDALYTEAQKYNLWRIKGFGNYSEWTNPRFNRDLAMAL